MTWYACTEADRIGNEGVALPPVGEHVLACTIRKKPLPSAKILEAFENAKLDAATAVSFVKNGLPFPPAVEAELKKLGVKQEYARSALIECYRVELEEKPRNQQASVLGWASDALPLRDDLGSAPTHWTTDLPEPLALP